MNPIRIALALAAMLCAPGLFAHGQEKHEPAQMTAGRDVSQAKLGIEPAAAEAVATVERFSAALGAGDLTKAGAELDPGVIILESGAVERSRDEYLGGHAKGDAAFLKSARISLRQRTARASGDLAWVSSESAIHTMKGKEMLMIDATETMVLRRSGQAWRIVHIHWSSRRAKDQSTAVRPKPLREHAGAAHQAHHPRLPPPTGSIQPAEVATILERQSNDLAIVA